MVVSACANLQWWGAAVTIVPLATTALALQAVKVLACPFFSPAHDYSASSFQLSFSLSLTVLGPTPSALSHLKFSAIP